MNVSEKMSEDVLNSEFIRQKIIGIFVKLQDSPNHLNYINFPIRITNIIVTHRNAR